MHAQNIQRKNNQYASRITVTPTNASASPPQTAGSGLSFTVEGVHPHDLATVLDQDGVCIRAGHHCAQPLMRRLNVAATARASVYVYNDEADIDALANGIQRAREMFGV